MDLDLQAQVLVQKIRHFIITNTGRIAETVSIQEFYLAFCAALREEMMINWTATYNTFEVKKTRMLYFFSMEYLPGRLLGNNISNIGAHELIERVLSKMNRTFHELIRCESDVGLGNGGLGRLSSCFLDSLATQQYPAMGYGLRYQYGIFEQEIWNGMQVERPDCWLLNTDPWEQRRDTKAVFVHFHGRPVHAKNKHGDDVYLLEDYEDVRALPYDTPVIGFAKDPAYSILSLRLWSTKESPRNFHLQHFNAGFLGEAAENTSLTDVLYPNDNTEIGKRVRLKQEFLLVAASLSDILRRHQKHHGDMTSLADKTRIQLNDTHPVLAIAELIRTLTKNYDFTWKTAKETALAIFSYTNHTILREALEEWDEGRLHEYMPRQHLIIQRLNHEFCDAVRNRFPHDEEKVRRMTILENGQIRMANLAVFGCHKINGVAQLHTEILKKKVFHDFYEMFPDRFINVTNGVTQRRWLNYCNPQLAAFITKRIGSGWITDFPQIAKLAPFASDPESQREFLEIKRHNKQTLIDYLVMENPIRDAKGNAVTHSAALDPSALFDVQIKRIHEYKRQLLNALHLIALYQELRDHPQTERVPRMAIFSGKAAPGYERAKQIIQLICAIARKVNADPAIDGHLRICFIENYNVSKAEIIIPAADLSEQISTAGWEASGTGNMKLAINGALTIGTEDGANIEIHQAVTDRWWPFSFGSSSHELAELHAHQTYHPADVYSKDPILRRALDALRDGTFAESPAEHTAFLQIFTSLVEGFGADRFFVLKDFRSYYETQQKAEKLFRDPIRWAETAIHNVAAMGTFSTDVSIQNYAEKIWDLKHCPPDPTILNHVREEYSEHDRCRIVQT